MNILLSSAPEHIGKEVTIQGWMSGKRSSGKIHFLQLRDGTQIIQGVVVKGEVDDSVFEIADTLTQESSLKVTGTLKEEPRSPTGVEMQVKSIEIVHLTSEEFPINKADHGPDFLLNHRHLWLRTKKQWAIQRVRNTVINATYEFFAKEDFTKIDAPIFTPTSCEDTTELFEVNYFEDKAYLTQSGQLYIEAAIFSFGRVFDFGPVFRSEKSKTRRHLTEFWMMDAEMAYVDQQGNMEIQEKLMKHIITRVLEKNLMELAITERDLEPLKRAVEKPFHHITHKDAVAMLKTMGSDITENDDLGADDETMLTEAHDNFIFVEKYPYAVKSFYMKKDPANPFYALCADLLAPEGYGEIIGGSQREDNYDELLKEIKNHNIPVETMQWYLDLRKYGSVPHSGFGYGLERIVRWLTGTHHIRETIPFPRLMNRIVP
ncbi:MAG: asparagine--tRNA ligase [Candidatus Gracilibacteria bacterium]